MKRGVSERERTKLQQYCSLFFTIVYCPICIFFLYSYILLFSLLLFSSIRLEFFIVFAYCFYTYFYICFCIINSSEDCCFYMEFKTLYNKKIYCHNCDKLFTLYYVSKDRRFDFVLGELLYIVSCPYCDFILMSEVKSKKAGEDAVEYARRLMG